MTGAAYSSETLGTRGATQAGAGGVPDVRILDANPRGGSRLRDPLELVEGAKFGDVIDLQALHANGGQWKEAQGPQGYLWGLGASRGQGNCGV